MSFSFMFQLMVFDSFATNLKLHFSADTMKIKDLLLMSLRLTSMTIKERASLKSKKSSSIAP